MSNFFMGPCLILIFFVAGRTSPAQVTLSLGVALEDMALAEFLYRRAR